MLPASTWDGLLVVVDVHCSLWKFCNLELTSQGWYALRIQVLPHPDVHAVLATAVVESDLPEKGATPPNLACCVDVTTQSFNSRIFGIRYTDEVAQLGEAVTFQLLCNLKGLDNLSCLLQVELLFLASEATESQAQPVPKVFTLKPVSREVLRLSRVAAGAFEHVHMTFDRQFFGLLNGGIFSYVSGFTSAHVLDRIAHLVPGGRRGASWLCGQPGGVADVKRLKRTGSTDSRHSSGPFPHHHSAPTASAPTVPRGTTHGAATAAASAACLDEALRSCAPDFIAVLEQIIDTPTADDDECGSLEDACLMRLIYVFEELVGAQQRSRTALVTFLRSAPAACYRPQTLDVLRELISNKARQPEGAVGGPEGGSGGAPGEAVADARSTLLTAASGTGRNNLLSATRNMSLLNATGSGGLNDTNGRSRLDGPSIGRGVPSTLSPAAAASLQTLLQVATSGAAAAKQTQTAAAAVPGRPSSFHAANSSVQNGRTSGVDASHSGLVSAHTGMPPDVPSSPTRALASPRAGNSSLLRHASSGPGSTAHFSASAFAAAAAKLTAAAEKAGSAAIAPGTTAGVSTTHAIGTPKSEAGGSVPSDLSSARGLKQQADNGDAGISDEGAAGAQSTTKGFMVNGIARNMSAATGDSSNSCQQTGMPAVQTSRSKAAAASAVTMAAAAAGVAPSVVAFLGRLAPGCSTGEALQQLQYILRALTADAAVDWQVLMWVLKFAPKGLHRFTHARWEELQPSQLSPWMPQEACMSTLEAQLSNACSVRQSLRRDVAGVMPRLSLVSIWERPEEQPILFLDATQAHAPPPVSPNGCAATPGGSAATAASLLGLPSSLQTPPLCGTTSPKDGVHAVILVHGFQGQSTDLRLVKAHLMAKYPYLMCFSSKVNEAHMHDSLADLGNRLADEVVVFLAPFSAASSRPLASVSFVGHSIGNLILRSALAVSKVLDTYRSRLWLYISVSGPHLGSLYGTNTVVDTGISLLKVVGKGRCLHELCASDASNFRDSFLFRLAREAPLSLFRHVVLIASAQDRYVPFHSARVSTCEAARKDTKRGHLYHEMLEAVLIGTGGAHPDANCMQLWRVDVDFNLQMKGLSLSKLIGRTAHIEFVESPVWPRILVWGILDKYQLLPRVPHPWV